MSILGVEVNFTSLSFIRGTFIVRPYLMIVTIITTLLVMLISSIMKTLVSYPFVKLYGLVSLSLFVELFKSFLSFTILDSKN
jgi:hypothetical protein